MLRIVTDSASDITLQQAAQMGIGIVPIDITFPDGICPQETEADFAVFYDKLQKCDTLPVTSQPSPELYLEYFEEAKAAGDDVIALPISSGLSGSVSGVHVAKQLCGYDRVFVVDSLQAIAGQRLLVERALKLAAQGVATEEIVAQLEQLRSRIAITGIIDTLEYLKKGGRIPASLAAIGTMLQIKPVIIVEDGILKTAGKVRGHEAGRRLLYSRFEKYPPDPDYPIYFLYSSSRELGKDFMDATLEKYGLQEFTCGLVPVGGVIGTHVGTNCVAICYVMKEQP